MDQDSFGKSETTSILFPTKVTLIMSYTPSNAGSNATRGSRHSSAIMNIPEPWERLTPLSRMGTPVNRPGTPGSDNTVRPNSRNQVMPYGNAPGALTIPGSTNQSASRYQAVPYQYAPSEASTWSRQPQRSEFEGGTGNAIRWVEEQRARERADNYRVSTTSQSTARPPQTQSREPERRRSDNSWVAPLAALGVAAVLTNMGRASERNSRRSDRDRDDTDRRSDGRRYDDDRAGGRSQRYRGSRDDDRYEDRRRSGR